MKYKNNQSPARENSLSDIQSKTTSHAKKLDIMTHNEKKHHLEWLQN